MALSRASIHSVAFLQLRERGVVRTSCSPLQSSTETIWNPSSLGTLTTAVEFLTTSTSCRPLTAGKILRMDGRMVRGEEKDEWVTTLSSSMVGRTSSLGHSEQAFSAKHCTCNDSDSCRGGIVSQCNQEIGVRGCLTCSPEMSLHSPAHV